ncbi:DNA repair protein RadC [Aliiglaciecola sp. LCG003]|uniref:RadC family protein n=1 Tax=Aliiglaciecola sp. LCG003 TaxID=3053655 RepID=UPI002574220F|nr:DNA repair protein RadC [Aliiglaciecola sp. LCG003]WJG09504.1 DNA repair protein RadC [Aliiglaciecola sp. LCG003]
MKLSQWPEMERPREKLLSLGCSALSDAELLAIFLRTGLPGLSAVDLARGLLQQFGSLRGLFAANQIDFCASKGLGRAKYVQLQAVLEISKRYFAESLQREHVFDSVTNTKHYLLSQLRDEPNEIFAVLFLDSQHRLIAFKKLFHGTINAASVYPRVVLQNALKFNAAALILTHNHPSGVAEPSQADKHITQRICQALELIDVTVLDHIVVGDGICVSFAERGLI